jgi:DNA-binding CsgD family transcriptional regulator
MTTPADAPGMKITSGEATACAPMAAGEPCFATPIFMSRESNYQFIQQIGADDRVVDFVPVDILDSDLTDVNECVRSRIGDYAIYGLQLPSSPPTLGSRDDLIEAGWRAFFEFDDKPTFRRMIAKFLNDPKLACIASLEPAHIGVPEARLTRREIETLTGIANGRSDSVIGQLLGINPATVNAHIENAKRKLGAQTRHQAMVKAWRSGQLADVPERDPQAQRLAVESLTLRQLQILALIASGHSDSTISQQLGVSPRTVEMHVSTARERLGLPTRSQAAALVSNGLSLRQRSASL